ncbi:MAG: hypothetical protein LBH45_06190 [Campylobacteraceae bacterium]|jgi:hypothetical protein|nr:hypothetical protein [Campylobacteraceae bacterium]
MNKYTSFKTAFLRNTTTAQNSRIFWIFITCALVFAVLFSCLIFNDYANILLSADFTHLRFVFLLIVLAGIICALNPKKFSNIGCGFGFIAAVLGIKYSLTLWTTYRFSETQEFFIQSNSFSKFANCFFNLSETNNECVFRVNSITENILSSYTSVISLNDFTNILKLHVWAFVAISTLFCMLYLYKEVKM